MDKYYGTAVMNKKPNSSKLLKGIREALVSFGNSITLHDDFYLVRKQ